MNLSKAGILMLSDRSFGVLALKSLLESDYNVFLATDLKSALGIMQAQSIDFALLDLTDETEERLEFISNLKHSREYHSILVGVTHENMTDEIAERAISTGAAYTLSSPMNLRVVKELVDNIVSTFIDDRKMREAEFAEKEERIRLFAETLDSGILEIAEDDDCGFRIRFAGENTLKFLDYDPESSDFIGIPVDRALYEKDMRLFYEMITKLEETGEPVSFTLRIKKRNGAFDPFKTKIRNMIMDRGYKVYIMAVSPGYEEDEKKDSEKERESGKSAAAELDPLTGIYSREAFFEKAERLVSENPDERYVLTVWDIDRFKAINEMFGLSAGDKLISEFADMLKKKLPEGSLYGRNESDKFVSIISEDNQKQLETGLNNVLEGHEIWHSLNCTVQLHVGMYRLDPGEYDIGVACDRAMMALAAIKDNYIYHLNYFTKEMRDKLLLEQEIVRNSEDALNNREFHVMLQPIVDTGTREISAAEALVRWKKADGGFVSPGDFIPIFEKNGFVTKVDMFVWEEVCAFQAERIHKGQRIVPISVNLSRMDFYDPEIFEKLDAKTKEYGIGADCIKVEVTESAYIENTGVLINSIQKFREAGYKVLMDDFGSGFSSLNMLKDFEVDVLKIDMKFMDTIDTSERAGNIINSVVQMAKAI
ncbi:MAG: EAL domain-containing protein, partial [Lachnospiraceae bacterium]|nr:EAL domain-containing protein [Lachnospiraceae bacterium]